MSKHAEWLSKEADAQAAPDGGDEAARRFQEAAAHIERLEEALLWYGKRIRAWSRGRASIDSALIDSALEAVADLTEDGGERARAALGMDSGEEG